MVSLTEQSQQYQPLSAAQAELETAYRLLLGACRVISEAGCTDKMGPELRDWWSTHPEANDERARHVLMSLPDEEINSLNAFIKRHGKLPTGLVADSPE